MAKKLIIGGLIVALVGALGLAIYNYTQSNQLLHAGQAMAYGNGGGQGYRGGQDGDEIAPSSGDRGQGYGRVNRDASGLGEPEPQAQVSEWLTFSGHVASVDTTGVTLQTDDGATLSISLGPEWFWSNQGLTLVPGERVTVQAFEEDGEIKVGQISLEDGTLLQLRDPDGRPLWAGRGRGGGRQ